MNQPSKYKFETVVERDLDLLFMLLLGESDAFVNLLLSPLGINGAAVTEIKHSESHQSLGESDIVVILRINEAKLGILIENKISAAAMPEQASRYKKRAELAIENGEYDTAIIYIFAPQNYLNTNAEAKNYPYRLSYEEILGFVERESISHRDMASTLIRRALSREKSGYILREDETVTRFWRNISAYFEENAPDIIINSSNRAKGANSTWIGIQTPLKRTALQYKTDFGCVDLEITGYATCIAELKTRLKTYISPDMIWVSTKKSVILPLPAPKSDIHLPFESFLSDMPELIMSIRKLTKLSAQINNDGILDTLHPRKIHK